jgi:hypothetical protein
MRVALVVLLSIGIVNVSRALALDGEHHRIPWSISLVAYDGVDFGDTVKVPMKEAVEFIESRSRFKLQVNAWQSDEVHSFTNFSCAPGNCVVVGRADVNTSRFPAQDSFVLLWTLNGRLPLHAGSTWCADWGISAGGINRPYASIPTDPWWYTNTPYGGFNSRAAQILVHEIINTINCKLREPPYSCRELNSSLAGAEAIVEADRLEKLTADCYERFEQFH